MKRCVCEEVCVFSKPVEAGVDSLSEVPQGFIDDHHHTLKLVKSVTVAES